MINNKLRHGRFTSSQIFRLMHNGRQADYIAEKRWERKLQRSIKTEAWSKPISWGNFVEQIAFEKLPMKYTLLSKVTTPHPKYGDVWAGSTDLITADAVGNIKCPELKAFCQLVDTADSEGNCDPEALRKHKYGEYFWQLISDACINEKQFCELIPYVPYFNDLSAIQDRAAASDDYGWIAIADSNTLAWLHKDAGYNDINILRFDATPYKDELEEQVLEAQKLLI